MFDVYILKSIKTGRYYIGSTSNLEERIIRHNKGRNKSTQNGIPWELIYKESYSSENEAYKREMQIKKYKGGEAFKKLVRIN